MATCSTIFCSNNNKHNTNLFHSKGSILGIHSIVRLDNNRFSVQRYANPKVEPVVLPTIKSTTKKKSSKKKTAKKKSSKKKVAKKKTVKKKSSKKKATKKKTSKKKASKRKSKRRR
jgi:hypothetical protein